jgi:hypothetical protein
VSSFRSRNKEGIRLAGGVGSSEYEDSLRAIVEKLGILTPSQSVRQTEEIFENPDGSRRSIEGIKQGFAQKEIELVETPTGIEAIDKGYINNAGTRAAKQGIFQPDISLLAQPQGTSIHVPETAGNVQEWIADPVARARFIPEEVDLNNATPAVMRARAIGMAEASGDRQAVFEANKRYPFSKQEVNQLAGDLLIKGQPLRSQVRMQGLGGRDRDVLDPATGQRVYEKSGPMKQAYYVDRANMGLGRWLESGATSFGDGRSNVVVPGFNYQLEHDRPFSKSIDAKPNSSTYYSDTLDNTAGYYERYENAEKGEVDPTDYYNMRRLHALAADEGVNLSGIAKADSGEELRGRESLNYILNRDNPSVIRGDRRRKDWEDKQIPERVSQNERLIERALNPVRKAGANPAIAFYTESGPGNLTVNL